MRSSSLFGISSAALVVAIGVAIALVSADSTAVVQTPVDPGIVLLPAPTTTVQFVTSTTVAMPTTTTVLFVGDVMLDRTVATRAGKDHAYPFAKLPTGWLDSFDYTVANLEGVLTDKRRPPEKSIDFQFDPAWATELKRQGFDAFSQANNHALDQGRAGSDDAHARLQAAGFLTFGDQVNDGDIALATTTVNGTHLALLGWNTTDNPLDKKEAEGAIKKAKASADITIAFMHWGTEYRDHPDTSSVEMAHWLIDQGVDVVVGGHPHWSQGAAMYKGKPILWSLGNFVFDQDWSDETRYGLAVSFEIADQKVKAIDLQPLRIDLSQPRLLTDEQKILRLEELARRSDADLADEVRSGRILVK